MATSQNGWPALPSDSPLLYTWDIPDTTRSIRLRNGSAGFLLIHLAMWFDAKMESVDGGIMDDWGYAYRPVRGYETTLSNHASGTAMDLNATKHPLGTDTFNAEDELKIKRRVNEFFDGALRWGGQYYGRKDQMHFELDVSLPAAERVARRLMDTPRGKRILEHNKPQRAVILS